MVVVSVEFVAIIKRNHYGVLCLGCLTDLLAPMLLLSMPVQQVLSWKLFVVMNRGVIMEKISLKPSIFALLIAVLLPLSVQAAAMNDYCIKPPFIQSVANPNLLLLIDNSASMFDLAYDDLGMKHCSITTTKDCTADPSICGAADGTCTVFDREPRYCFDETYSSANAYVGYFNRFQSDGTSTQFYSYDWNR